jgi:osmotically-inducible protein OsmY
LGASMMKKIEEDIKLSERHYTSEALEKIGRKIIKRNLSNNGDINNKELDSQSDFSIRQNILETLYRSTLLDSSKIEVYVDEGRVSLKGSVKTSLEKDYAPQVVKYVPGIVEIYNDLIVRDDFIAHEGFHI